MSRQVPATFQSVRRSAVFGPMPFRAASEVPAFETGPSKREAFRAYRSSHSPSASAFGPRSLPVNKYSSMGHVLEITERRRSHDFPGPEMEGEPSGHISLVSSSECVRCRR